MKLKHVTILAVSAALIAAAAVSAISVGKSVVVAKADLKWKDMGIPGVAAAPVSGDMQKGASRFFLKYPVGFVTPRHHHTADHYVTVVSGTITLNVAGKDHRLGPGSYFALTGKAPHTAKVEGNQEAVFFIQADGPWDAVMERERSPLKWRPLFFGPRHSWDWGQALVIDASSTSSAAGAMRARGARRAGAGPL